MRKIIGITMVLFLSLVSCKSNKFNDDLITLHLNEGTLNESKTLVLTKEEFKEIKEYPVLENHLFCSYYVDSYFDERFDGDIDNFEGTDLYAKYTEDIFEYEVQENELLITDIEIDGLDRAKVVVPDYILNKRVTTLTSESFADVKINVLELEWINNIEIDTFKNARIRYIKVGSQILNIENGAFRNMEYFYNITFADNKYYSATNNVIFRKFENRQREIIGYYNEYWNSMFSEQHLDYIDIIGIAEYSFSNIYVEEDYVYVKDENGVVQRDEEGNPLFKPSPEGFSLYVPSNMDKLSDHAFDSCKVYRFNENEEELEIQLGVFLFHGLKEIGKYAFKDSSLTLVKYETKIENNYIVPYGEGVEIFKEGAFQNTKIKNFTIPKSLKTIEKDCFKGCDELETIYYEGTEEEFSNIEIAEGNEVLNNAKIYYFSTEEQENGWFYSPESVSTPVSYDSLIIS